MDFQTREITRLIEEQVSTQRELGQLKSMISSSVVAARTAADPLADVVLPLKSVDAFRIVEEKAASSNFREELVSINLL